VDWRSDRLQPHLQRLNEDADFEVAIRAMLNEEGSALGEETVARNAKTVTRAMQNDPPAAWRLQRKLRYRLGGMSRPSGS